MTKRNLPPFPGRHRWRVAVARDVDGVFDQPHLVNIAGTVLEDLGGPHANDELRALEFRQQRVGLVQCRFTVDAESSRVREIDEQQADLRESPSAVIREKPSTRHWISFLRSPGQDSLSFNDAQG